MISYFVFEVSPILHTRTLPCGADRVFKTPYVYDKAREEMDIVCPHNNPTDLLFHLSPFLQKLYPGFPIHLTRPYVGHHNDLYVKMIRGSMRTFFFSRGLWACV